MLYDNITTGKGVNFVDIKRYQNYIFDLYGTLVDIHTEEDKPALWDTLARYLLMKGLPARADRLHSDYRRLCEQAKDRKEAENAAKGRTGPAEPDLLLVWKQLCPAMSVQELQDLACLFRTLSTEKLRLYDWAWELLAQLRYGGKRVYLLSNAQECFTLPELRLLDLPGCFDGILLSSQAGVKKPSPEFYGQLMKKYHLDPEKSLMIGNDDEADCRGAAAVGMDSVYISTEQSPAISAPLPENCRQVKNLRQIFQELV